MTDQALYPLRFAPIFQYRLWGGRALGDFMDVQLPGDEPIGEAWILSDRADYASPVANGPLAGQTLSQLMQQRKAEILGKDAARFERFPLLLKFLDVEKMLSVQVHPRDDQAALISEGDSGKTEAWIVLRARQDARIYAGLKPGTSPDDLASLTAANADSYLPSFTPEPGQAVMIEAGTVHSLGDGVLVFEVQENSDTTFRLFDWDHVDARTGKPRELQIDKALAAIDFAQGPIVPLAGGTAGDGLLSDPHFRLSRWQQPEHRAKKWVPVFGNKRCDNKDLERADDSHLALPALAEFPVGAPGEARVLVCAGGDGRVIAGDGEAAMKRGDVVLLPATVGAGRFCPGNRVTLFEIAIPPANSFA